MTNNQLTPESVTRFAQYGADMMEWPDGGYVKYEDYAALAAELQERRKVNADLTMWVKRLGYSLKRANPDSKLPGEAMAYLSAKGIISVGDILR
ncbi:hypothetical protein RI820_000472 [Pluralibacter gergoviae]|nr:hypothetical protein [Pluralibacter gergoviae]ELC3015634.1 hypothetical protein [Pluralibacter gergoviae]ELC3020613.1 hypothetical protein [Pluralibacter gergoviae]